MSRGLGLCKETQKQEAGMSYPTPPWTLSSSSIKTRKSAAAVNSNNINQ